jgi:glycosyltransferase involved in cell wall biosynthesis
MTNRGKQDIIHYMSASPDKLHVIYESYNELCRLMDRIDLARVKEQYSLPDRFILFVGGVTPSKNLGNLLRAYGQIRQAFPHKLVLVGFKRWKFQKDFALVDRLGLHDRILCTGFIPDEDIPALYNLADVFVFPSLYEGFGMPVLEAMACGCPVITSKTGCSPEVAGGAALLIDPYHPDEIAESIRRVLTERALREQLIRKGLQRVQQFSWENTAKATLALFESLANTPP